MKLEQLELDKEPPGEAVIEEPPSSRLLKNRHKFFDGVTDEYWDDWKWQFRHRIKTVEELSKILNLDINDQINMTLVAEQYPISITPYYFCLINHDDIKDPIRIQSIPSFDELVSPSYLSADPLEEVRDSAVPGLIHRYKDRALMVITDICPMFCRHCTRKREWRNGNWVRSTEDINRMIDYIRQNREIRDVIISGGDPLTLSTAQLECIIEKIRDISHVEIIRIGSRVPVVLPQRIDDDLCSMLSKYRPIWFNTHFNHVNEITEESALACEMLASHGIPINNQSVLIAGVNDTVSEQIALCQGLLKINVRPYYLFQADEVEGTEHLRTTIETGVGIIAGMRGRTSGLGIPTYIVDLPGGGGKIPIQSDYLDCVHDNELEFRNYLGKSHVYHNPVR